jgi:hypothetical protein
MDSCLLTATAYVRIAFLSHSSLSSLHHGCDDDDDERDECVSVCANLPANDGV